MPSPPAARHPALLGLTRAAGIAFLLLAAALPWSIAPMSIGVALAAALTLAVWWAPGGPRWTATPVDRPAIAWLAALVIATVASVDPGGSAPRITKGLLVGLVSVAATHAREERRGRLALALLFVSAALAALYAFVRFASEGGAFPARARGAAGHALTYGGQVLLLASLAAAVALRGRERRWRLAAAALLALLLPALLATYTRSAWLGFIVAAGVIVARTRARWLVALGIAVAALAISLPGAYRARALSVADPANRWNVERVRMWGAGLRMFRDRPVTGVGLQDLHPLYERYRSPEAMERVGHLHSVPVHVAATMGLVGLAALAWLIAGLFRTAAGGGAPPGSALGGAVSLGVIAGLAGFLVAGLFEWNFGDEELLDLLFVLVGIAFSAARWGEPRPSRVQDPP
jgi:O-antigen ligase